MKTSQFSAEFLAKLGVQSWQENAGFVSARTLKTPPKPQTDFVQPDMLVEEVVDSSVSPTCQDVSAPNLVAVSAPNPSLSFVADKVPFIVIGEGLSGIWQNEDALEWQLWKNICEVFAWDSEQIPFYDTLHLVSEDAIFATLEEIMEMEVDWVLSMDSDSLFAEHLQEGLRLKTCPSLSLMLSDAYAKKSFYQIIMQLS